MKLSLAALAVAAMAVLLVAGGCCSFNLESSLRCNTHAPHAPPPISSPVHPAPASPAGTARADEPSPPGACGKVLSDCAGDIARALSALGISNPADLRKVDSSKVQALTSDPANKPSQACCKAACEGNRQVRVIDGQGRMQRGRAGHTARSLADSAPALPPLRQNCNCYTAVQNQIKGLVGGSLEPFYQRARRAPWCFLLDPCCLLAASSPWLTNPFPTHFPTRFPPAPLPRSAQHRKWPVLLQPHLRRQLPL